MKHFFQVLSESSKVTDQATIPGSTPGRARNSFVLCQCVQTGSGAQAASYPNE
jgi:hypothetical protein